MTSRDLRSIDEAGRRVIAACRAVAARADAVGDDPRACAVVLAGLVEEVHGLRAALEAAGPWQEPARASGR